MPGIKCRPQTKRCFLFLVHHSSLFISPLCSRHCQARSRLISRRAPSSEHGQARRAVETGTHFRLNKKPNNELWNRTYAAGPWVAFNDWPGKRCFSPLNWEAIEERILNVSHLDFFVRRLNKNCMHSKTSYNMWRTLKILPSLQTPPKPFPFSDHDFIDWWRREMLIHYTSCFHPE